MTNKYLVLFEDCRIVRGAKNNLIVDLNREGNSNYIPVELIEFLDNCKEKPLDKVLIGYKDAADLDVVKGYVSFLLNREFCFLADKHLKKHIGTLSLRYFSPSIIDNAILQVNPSSICWCKRAILQLSDKLLCSNIELRCEQVSEEDLYELLSFFDNTLVTSIVLQVLYEIYMDNEFLENLLKVHPRITEVNIFSAPAEKLVSDEIIKFHEFDIDFKRGCGFVSESGFVVNQELFFESQAYNTCLNKKLSIDVNGDIKNCPSMPQSFGNIKDTTLEEALSHPDFKKYWNIKKDDITKCKDCEFRYICTDCRAYIDDPDDMYSAPLKCGYDPYTGEWEEWSTNPLKQKAIKFYGMEDLMLKKNRL